VLFERFEPSDQLRPYVREYWIYENPDTAVRRQKIIPDGYCEIIFRYGDPTRINLHGEWEVQEGELFAGQISSHFYMENTGVSGILGVKLRPAAPYHLFGIPMDEFTDRVVGLEKALGTVPPSIGQLTDARTAPARRIQLAERWLSDHLPVESTVKSKRISGVVETIFRKNGLVDIEALAEEHHVSRRHLEREFKQVVGLTFKFFSRIIRFNFIFEVMKSGDTSWIDIALKSGFFDQAHFIKNFREFTGENPSEYGFEEKNLANFFLRK
jgi:methylphosphotriester-DNA--protein-cysteine methyltransferase